MQPYVLYTHFSLLLFKFRFEKRKIKFFIKKVFPFFLPLLFFPYNQFILIFFTKKRKKFKNIAIHVCGGENKFVRAKAEWQIKNIETRGAYACGSCELGRLKAAN